MLSLRYSAPSPNLRGSLSSYYLFRADLPHVVDTTRADLPQLRFMLSGQGFYTFGDGSMKACPPAMLTGTTTAATRFEAVGPLWVFGIGLLPNGWASLVGTSAAEFADGVEDAEAVMGRSAGQMLQVLRETVEFDDMVSLMDVMLTQLFERPRERSMNWFVKTTDDWLLSENSPRIDVLMKETGLSARQLERMTNRIYGAPPKLLARKYRTLRIASRMSAQDDSWRDLAGDAYYDQSHFIRDFKRFTGQTPRQFQLNPSPVTQLMSARRKLGPLLPLLALES